MFELPAATESATAAVSIDGQPLAATLRQDGNQVKLAVDDEVIVTEGQALDVTFVF